MWMAFLVAGDRRERQLYSILNAARKYFGRNYFCCLVRFLERIIAAMNFQTLVSELRKVMTLEAIAQEVGLHSRGAVHGIATGHQKNVTYDVGTKLVALRKRKAKAIAAAKKAAL